MATTNERKYGGENSENIFEVQIRDTAEYDLPDIANGDAFSVEGTDNVAVKVVNTLDQGATIDLETTNYKDGGFTEAYADASGVTVASGAVEMVSPDFPGEADWARLTASCGTAPTSGKLKVVFMTDDDE